ncbi:pescadillo homolog isoform X2 [Octopus sinensis]|uniref:Pescadillo homolog n=1 Tax=Octopus sinensis TaxID=2607531 RepID=A0A7E6FNS6_9MOLL|nr:pescadillo homolog isoform X2 [Octopus sinensis]
MQRDRKYEKGEATQFITRRKAIQRLQLSLPDFRRLCILKGVYPQEPKKKKAVGHGSRAIHTYYHVKDIAFLSHEPIIKKFREFKHYMRRLKRVKEKRVKGAAKRMTYSRPTYKLDHVVRERYPTFADAICDLDDCLSLLFLFATFPKMQRVKIHRIRLCRRLTVEFMHYIIASKSLRKVFISIKGIYFQADIQGTKVNWVIPHAVAHNYATDVDYKIMETFVEFYTTLMGFTNYRLYNSVNLYYPPQFNIGNTSKQPVIDDSEESDIYEEQLAAMTQQLKKHGDNVEEEIDEFPVVNPENPDEVEMAKMEYKNLLRFQNLFKGLKFFLNREVPREYMVFIIRSFGGEVSWSNTGSLGHTYQEDDETISHQIVDRPNQDKKYLSRYYVQPQWVFDCVNAQKLLPVEDYFPGVLLPPHLSPFVVEEEGEYIPPEKLAQMSEGEGEEEEAEEEEEEMDVAADVRESSESEAEEKISDKENGTSPVKKKTSRKKAAALKKRKLAEQDVSTAPKKSSTKKMHVIPGSVEKVDEVKVIRQQKEEKKLAEMMIPKKKKKLYDKIVMRKKKIAQETRKLKQKREAIEKEKKTGKTARQKR